MRILAFCPHYYPSLGGTEILTSYLFEALHERGFEISVVADEPRFTVADSSAKASFPVQTLPVSRALMSGKASEVGDLIRKVIEFKTEFRPDLIHLHDSSTVLFLHYHTRLHRPAPAIVTVHSLPSASLGGSRNADAMLTRCVKEADWVAGVSEFILAAVRLLWPGLENKSSLIHNALPASSACPPFRPDSKQIICIGRLSKEKGFDLAIRSFAAVLKLFPGRTLLIAGSGPEEENLKRLSSDLGLGDHVIFAGAVPHQETSRLLSDSYLSLIPSRWEEPFCLTALESALASRPVVAARAGGLPEVIIDGETGLLFDRDNEEALIRALTDLLSSPHVAQAMGEKARTRALKKFSFRNLIDAYESLYRTVRSR